MAPLEVEIEQLVLRGIREPDAPAVLTAFREHLAALLVDPGTPLTAVAEFGRPDGAGVLPEHETERLGRELALAVARAVRR
ncbi:hypothetical protein ACWGGS_01705 [Streptomyces decoyicus]